MRKLLILGAGGYGRTVADVAQQLGCYDRIAFLDNLQTGENILGKCEDYRQFSGEFTECLQTVSVCTMWKIFWAM